MTAQIKVVYREVRGEQRPGDLDQPLNSATTAYSTPNGHIWRWRDQLERNYVSVLGTRGLAGALNLTEPITCEK